MEKIVEIFKRITCVRIAIDEDEENPSTEMIAFVREVATEKGLREVLITSDYIHNNTISVSLIGIMPEDVLQLTLAKLETTIVEY